MNLTLSQKPAPVRGNRFPARFCGAFTLVELLLVMAIFAMMALMMLRMVGNTTELISRAEKRIDTDAQSRLIFDRMASDFQGMAKNPSVNFWFNAQTGNDAFYFFSEATGHFADSDPYGIASTARNTVSLVGYRVSDVTSGNTRFELERLGRGLHWFDYAPGSGDSTSVCYLPSTISTNFSTPLSDPYNNSSNPQPGGNSGVPQWDVVGNLVVRMECCLLLKDGSLSVLPIMKPFTTQSFAPAANNASGGIYTSGSRWYDQDHKVGYICTNGSAGNLVWAPLGLQDVSAVVVAIAVIDSRSRIIANKTALAKFSSLLPDFNPDNPTLMSVVWQNVINQPGFATEIGLPPSAAAGVHIYQRYFYF